jgi:hypothetical protein
LEGGSAVKPTWWDDVGNFSTFPFLLLVLPALAWAEGDERFARVREGAEVLPSVSGFLERYVGACAAAAQGGLACERAALASRKAAEGKRYAVILTDVPAGLLQLTDVDAVAGTFTLNFTPFLAGNDTAVTQGTPRGTDGAGNPVLPFLRVEGTLPEGWSAAMMNRQVQAQALRVQVVFTPQGLWSLPRRGKAPLRGVKARFEGVLVTVGRTGDQVGLWTAR